MCLSASNNSLKDDDVLIVVADVEKTSDCENAVKKTVEHFKQLDILINSAGIISKGTNENTSLDDFDKMMNINTRSVFYISQKAIPHLKKTKGNLNRKIRKWLELYLANWNLFSFI